MAKAITSIGKYSNTLAVVRQLLSGMFADCVLATASAGAKGEITIATTNPPQFYSYPTDTFNEEQWESYCYYGTNKGTTQLASDWDVDTHKLSLTPDAALEYDITSKVELHHLFYSMEYLNAINQAIAFYNNGSKYLLDLKDETTISLTRTERNDVDDSYINTYEYALPTDCLWLNRVTTEDSVVGVKITGTVSAAFTLGEQVEGSSSSATGLVSYSGSTYIRVREESGTFTTSDTVTGQDSGKTVTSISDIDRTEVAGDGKFPPENKVDPRDWRVLKPSEPKLKLMEGHYTVVEDLRLRLEYQGIQDDVTADTDTIMLPIDEFVKVAATFLPFSKIESDNLRATFNDCLRTRDEVKARPSMHPYPNARKCW